MLLTSNPPAVFVPGTNLQSNHSSGVALHWPLHRGVPGGGQGGQGEGVSGDGPPSVLPLWAGQRCVSPHGVLHIVVLQSRRVETQHTFFLASRRHHLIIVSPPAPARTPQLPFCVALALFPVDFFLHEWHGRPAHWFSVPRAVRLPSPTQVSGAVAFRHDPPQARRVVFAGRELRCRSHFHPEASLRGETHAHKNFRGVDVVADTVTDDGVAVSLHYV